MKKISAQAAGMKLQPGLSWGTRDEIFSPIDRAEIPHVIDRKFQPGLKFGLSMCFEVKFKREITAWVNPVESSSRAESLHVINPLTMSVLSFRLWLVHSSKRTIFFTLFFFKISLLCHG